ncbi:hypothetical protein ACTQV0_09580 [Selenomonas montiformis]|uniref:Uncharacterized protein n=1 Tax=Selenomonas montiformis TaxID=2652285 RepID=A0A6I2V1X3_9FIRM|nr:hypothetical protein [Selenomonas montiformis]MDY4696700.1 hypothetical protein [Selenomonas montiformis]MSV25472.1 hypothetical protein [Selenomonas montiformis]
MTVDTQGKELACIDKLGTMCAMSEWTEDQLQDVLELLRDYGQSRENDGYEAGYEAALNDAVAAAERNTVG